MRPLLYFITIFLFLQPCTAQIPPVITITTYNESNGITQGKATAMLQGKDGYLWLGTSNGLLRFDGYNFRSYTSPAIINSISQLATDYTGKIWMSFLGGGIASFNPVNGTFKNYTITTDKDSSLATREIETLFFDSKNHLWLTITQKGLIRADIEKNKFTSYNIINDSDSRYTPAFRKIYNSVYKIAEGKDGIFWLATHDGLYRFNPANDQLQAIRDPNAEKNVRHDLFGSVILEDNVLWLGAWAGGLSRYNIQTGQWNTWLPGEADKSWVTTNLVTSIAQRNKHQLWICTADRGLGIFDKEKEQFYFFSHNPLYPNVPAEEWYKFITDKENNLWALQESGLLKIQVPDYKFTFHSFNVTRTDNRSHFLLNDWWENKNWQLIATSFADGLHVMNKQTGVSKILPIEIFPSEEPIMAVMQVLADRNKRIWVRTRDVIYQFDTVQGKLIKVPQPPLYSAEKPSNSFTETVEDHQGNIWFTTRRNGIFVWNNRTHTYRHYGMNEKGNQFVDNNYFQAAAVDQKGRVWLGSSYGFLGYAESDSTAIRSWAGQLTGISLPGNQVYLLYSDSKGNIWAAGFYGLYYFDCSGEKPKLVKIYKAADGLRSNLVNGIREDNQGKIWCVTEAAVCQIDPSNESVISYDASDGLTTGTIGLGLVASGNDSMLLLSYGGYFSFSIKSKQAKTIQSPLLLTRMMVNDKEFYYDEFLKNGKSIDLRPDQNTFSFEFASLSFNRPGKQHYQYKLDGFDKDWIDAEGRRFISYTNIPGGHYTFMVRAVDEMNLQQISELSIPFFIHTPFYKTALFYILLILAISALIYAVYLNRMRHQKQVHRLQYKAQLLEKEKALVMYDSLKQQLNPHFLFNSLSSLSSLIQSDQKLADNFLGHLSSVYRYILKSRDKEKVSVEEELKFVKQYIELQKTRFKDGLQVHIDVNEDCRSAKVTPVVLQNLVENAIKHNCTDPDAPLIIKIYCEKDHLIVSNNLIPRGFVETSNKQGLKNLKTLYTYYTKRPVLIEESADTFTIKLPLL